MTPQHSTPSTPEAENIPQPNYPEANHSPTEKSSSVKFFSTPWGKRLWKVSTLLSFSGLAIFFSQPGQSWFNQLSLRLEPPPEKTKAETSQPRTALPVQTKTIQVVHSHDVLRTYTGMLKAKRHSQLGFERSGTLVALTVDEGQWVAAGSPLGQLDTTDLKLQRQELLAQRAQASLELEELKLGARNETIAAAAANVRELQSELKLAQIKQTRRASLFEDGAISREQLEEVSFSVEMLQAQLDQAQSQLDELVAGEKKQTIQAQGARIAQWDARIAKLDLEIKKGTLIAPFSGSVTERLANEGMVLTPGQTVLGLIEDGVIEAHIGVPTAMVQRLSLGSRHTIEINQSYYPATVKAILPELEESTQTQTVVLALASSANKAIAPGQTARLSLKTRRSINGFWLPSTALVQGEQGIWSCYVLADIPENDALDTDAPLNDLSLYTVQRQTIDVLHTESDRILVQGNLQSGDRVVISGTHRIVPGQWVKPKTSLPTG